MENKAQDQGMACCLFVEDGSHHPWNQRLTWPTAMRSTLPLPQPPPLHLDCARALLVLARPQLDVLAAETIPNLHLVAALLAAAPAATVGHAETSACIGFGAIWLLAALAAPVGIAVSTTNICRQRANADTIACAEVYLRVPQ